MSFPTSLPSYTITSGTDHLGDTDGGSGISALLNAFETDVTALGTKMGTGASTPTVNKVLVGSGVGTSQWSSTLAGLTLTAPVLSGTATGTYTLGGTPTITQPTIADFTNAQHSHANAAGGGQLGTSAHTNASITADKLATGAANGSVAANETTTSTSYVNLSTTTDTVTVTIGANGLALVAINASLSNSTVFQFTWASFAISGATTVAAGAANGEIMAQEDGTYGNVSYQFGGTFLVTGLTPGSTTFKMKYRVDGGTGGAASRRIGVVPL